MGRPRAGTDEGARSALATALARSRALVEAVRVISTGEQDLDATLDALVDQTVVLLGASDVVINLRDVDGRFMRRRASTMADPAGGFAAIGVPAVVSSLTAEALETRRPVVVADFRHDPRVTQRTKEAFPSVTAALVVPLIAQDAVRGRSNRTSTRTTSSWRRRSGGTPRSRSAAPACSRTRARLARLRRPRGPRSKQLSPSSRRCWTRATTR